MLPAAAATATAAVPPTGPTGPTRPPLHALLARMHHRAAHHPSPSHPPQSHHQHQSRHLPSIPEAKPAAPATRSPPRAPILLPFLDRPAELQELFLSPAATAPTRHVYRRLLLAFPTNQAQADAAADASPRDALLAVLWAPRERLSDAQWVAAMHALVFPCDPELWAKFAAAVDADTAVQQDWDHSADHQAAHSTPSASVKDIPLPDLHRRAMRLAYALVRTSADGADHDRAPRSGSLTDDRQPGTAATSENSLRPHSCSRRAQLESTNQEDDEQEEKDEKEKNYTIHQTQPEGDALLYSGESDATERSDTQCLLSSSHLTTALPPPSISAPTPPSSSHSPFRSPSCSPAFPPSRSPSRSPSLSPSHSPSRSFSSHSSHLPPLAARMSIHRMRNAGPPFGPASIGCGASSKQSDCSTPAAAQPRPSDRRSIDGPGLAVTPGFTAPGILPTAPGRSKSLNSNSPRGTQPSTRTNLSPGRNGSSKRSRHPSRPRGHSWGGSSMACPLLDDLREEEDEQVEEPTGLPAASSLRDRAVHDHGAGREQERNMRPSPDSNSSSGSGSGSGSRHHTSRPQHPSSIRQWGCPRSPPSAWDHATALSAGRMGDGQEGVVPPDRDETPWRGPPSPPALIVPCPGSHAQPNKLDGKQDPVQDDSTDCVTPLSLVTETEWDSGCDAPSSCFSSDGEQWATDPEDIHSKSGT